MNKRHAFTLIEMLVVIAIIGIVAALVVNMNGAAQAKKKQAQVEGDKHKLMLMIEEYQSKLNFYPPDNGNLANYSLANYAANYDAWAATNPLIYELTGATNNYQNSGNIVVFDSNTNISSTMPSSTIFSNLFGRSAVANANQDEPHSFYIPQPKEYTNYDAVTGLKGLLVPVSMVSPTGAPITNFWHYDASSTNRHNLSSYDLWAEYVLPAQHFVGSLHAVVSTNIIITNGNW